MLHFPSSRSRSLVCLSLIFVAASCGGTASTPGDPVGTTGELIVGADGRGVIVDPNSGGAASALRLEEALWGRLVDVYDVDGTLVFRDLLIGENAADDPDLALSSDVATGGNRLQVLHRVGTEAFATAIREAEDGLGKVDPKSDAPTALPPFSVVPRNAAIALRFSDLIDSATMSSRAVEVLVGDPAVNAFAARVVPDPNHGGILRDGSGTSFHSTRILVDFQVSETEAAAAGLGTPTGVGLPAGARTLRPSAVVRVPTQADPQRGLFQVVANLRGATLAEEGPMDTGSTTRDLVRAFRAGSNVSGIVDPFNGFLRDDTSPELIGHQPVTLIGAAEAENGLSRVEFRYSEPGCAIASTGGDRLTFGGLTAVVRTPGTLNGATVSDVVVEVLGGASLAESVGSLGTHTTTFRPEEGHQAACFLTVFPDPGSFPLTDVSPTLTITAEFSEPMDPTTLDGLEGLHLTSVASNPGPTQIIVADVEPSIDRSRFEYKPRLPLNHIEGTSEAYFAHVGTPSRPATDLAGNPLRASFEGLALTLDRNAPTDRTSGYVFRFEDLDEDGDGYAEVRGQTIQSDGALLPRPVRHMSLPVDRGNKLIDNMQQLPHSTIPSPYDLGVQAPLNPRGSRLMTTWRYGDVGLDVTNEEMFNLDVEAIHWQVQGSAVATEVVDHFSMELSHSTRLPDEAADLTGPTILASNSGLVNTSFEANRLGDSTLVHPGDQGYTILPSNSSSDPLGRVLIPFPMNQGNDPSKYRYFTWRDTAIQETGADDSLGIPFGGLANAGLIPMSEVTSVARPGNVPSIGLPLLMDFKTRPGLFSGTNRLLTRLAGFPLSFGFDLPANTRVFSEGGTNNLGDVINVEPDLVTTPSGGFSVVPAIAPLGTPTSSADSLVYMGQLDVVTRVSRVHTLWLEAGPAGADLVNPVVVPRGDDQPDGTQVGLAFRGARLVFGVPLMNASAFDAYGDLPAPNEDPDAPEDLLTYGSPENKNAGITFINDDVSWKPSIQQLNGSSYVQARITFVSNAVSGARPTLQALGFAYDLPN